MLALEVPWVSSVVLLLGAGPGIKKLGMLALRLLGKDTSMPDTLPTSLPFMASLGASEAVGVGMKNEGGPAGILGPAALGMPGRPPMPGSFGPGCAGLLPVLLFAVGMVDT
jgi:hypothetical protein